jgi:multiple sugar transport system permease protein
MFAMGLKGPLFIIIFRQFFRTLPAELEEAAIVDGAGPLRTFLQVMLPLARPAIIVSFLFSLVWHWNDYFEPLIYLNRRENFTLPMRLSVLQATLNELTGGQGDALFNEALIMSACFLIIVPPLIVYFFTQRFFTESIERTGLAGM